MKEVYFALMVLVGFIFTSIGGILIGILAYYSSLGLGTGTLISVMVVILLDSGLYFILKGVKGDD